MLYVNLRFAVWQGLPLVLWQAHMARGAAQWLTDFLMSKNPLPVSSSIKCPVRLCACDCWRVKFRGGPLGQRTIIAAPKLDGGSVWPELETGVRRVTKWAEQSEKSWVTVNYLSSNTASSLNLPGVAQLPQVFWKTSLFQNKEAGGYRKWHFVYFVGQVTMLGMMPCRAEIST